MSRLLWPDSGDSTQEAMAGIGSSLNKFSYGLHKLCKTLLPFTLMAVTDNYILSVKIHLSYLSVSEVHVFFHYTHSACMPNMQICTEILLGKHQISDEYNISHISHII